MPKMPLWTLEEIGKALDVVPLLGQAHGAEANNNPIFGISIDTRSLSAGDLFVALAGDQSDGHNYLEHAISAGANAVLVERGHAQVEGLHDKYPNIAIFSVPNVLEGLTHLAHAARARSTAKIIAVTGSVGKTSVKEKLKACLSRSGNTHAAEKSFNNHIGVPLTLARLPRDTDYGVFEIGMNHAGEISPLSKLVQPHVAIITTIGTAHIETLGSIEAIADAKAEIFDGLIGERIAILPADNSFYDQLCDRAQNKDCQIIGFGKNEDFDTFPVKVHAHQTCSCVDARVQGQAITYKVAEPGEHHVLNSLAVLTAVNCIGADLALAGLELAQVEALSGRGQRHVIDFNGFSFTLVDESYNANPTSMRAAITTLSNMRQAGGGRHIIVLGDMVELGDMAQRLHEELADFINNENIDRVYTCGAHMAALNAKLDGSKRGSHVDNPNALLPLLESEIRHNDVVMVKGSNSTRMGLIVDHFLSFVDPKTLQELGV